MSRTDVAGCGRRRILLLLSSGYSKGLMLLFLGHKSEERHMRVSPWNQYRLVNPEPEPEPDFYLASRQDQTSRGCASFLHFRRSSAGHNDPSPELSTVYHPDALAVPCEITNPGNDENRNEICLRSSLKKPFHWVYACGGDLAEIKKFEVSSYGASEDGFEDKHERGCGCVIQ